MQRCLVAWWGARDVFLCGCVALCSEIEIPGVHAGFVERVMKAIYGGDYMYIWVRYHCLTRCCQC